MKKKIIFLVFCFTMNSCSLFFFKEINEHYEKQIKLLQPTDLDSSKQTLLRIFLENDYEIQFTMQTMEKYTHISSHKEIYDEIVQDFSELLDSTERKFITSPIVFYGQDGNDYFYLNFKELFESGKYLIYNNKLKKYISVVEITAITEIKGPLEGYGYYCVRDSTNIIFSSYWFS